MKVIVATFYRTRAGNQPVLDWLRGLSVDDAKIVGEDMKLVEEGWPIGMPTCRPLGEGLYEVRSTIHEGKLEARVYFTIIGSLMLILNHQEGKSGQQDEIKRARDRLRDHERREAEKLKQSKKG